MFRTLLFCIGILSFLSCCQFSSPSHAVTLFSQNVMTIDYHITIGDPLTQNKKKEIQQIIDQTFAHIDAIFNKWNPLSELSQLNQLEAQTPYLLSSPLYAFLLRLDEFVTLSEGRFDPTIEPLQALWKRSLEKGHCPKQDEIANLIPCLGWSRIHFKDGIFSKEDARTQLDLGGVAKGLCVDLLVENLQKEGLHHLFVEWGGEIRTLGQHPSGRPWHVYISRFGNPDPMQAIAHIDLHDQALATSGDYFQYWKVETDEGKKKVFCHILNPLNYQPLEVKEGSIASASLLAHDCVTADALAKVLMLFPCEEEAESWFKKVQTNYPYLHCWMVKRPSEKE